MALDKAKIMGIRSFYRVTNMALQERDLRQMNDASTAEVIGFDSVRRSQKKIEAFSDNLFGHITEKIVDIRNIGVMVDGRNSTISTSFTYPVNGNERGIKFVNPLNPRADAILQIILDDPEIESEGPRVTFTRAESPITKKLETTIEARTAPTNWQNRGERFIIDTVDPDQDIEELTRKIEGISRVLQDFGILNGYVPEEED